MKFFFLSLLLSILIFSCKQEKKEGLFELMEHTGVDFSNKVVDQQIENSFYYRNYYNGGGVALGDINNDSLPDIFLTSNMGDNKLYLNKGNFKFDDITSHSGMRQDSMWSTGTMMVDINNDGWLDIYVCNSGHMKNGNRRNKLYINNHDLTFTESAAAYGLAISAYTTQVSFFDYDLDGDLDCFMIDNSPMPINNLGYTNRRNLPDAQWPVADFLKGGGDHLYRNDNNKFTEVTLQAGIHGSLISFGLGVSVGDINGDGYPDVYVANDSYERDYLYINQKNGSFKDEFEDCMEQNSFSSMGADLSDVNNDGYVDLFTTDMLPPDDYRLKTLGAFDNIDLYNKRLEVGLYRQFMKNCLYINNKNGGFYETANYSKVAGSDWSWGALFFDADNDGLNDIYVCNGINRDVTNLDFMDFFANDVVQKMIISGEKQNVDSVLQHIPINPLPNKAFKNNGHLQFTDAGEEWGFMQPSLSNGAAYADLDNDGDLDLVINNTNEPAFIYKNKSREKNGNNYIGVQLKGKDGNGFAIGSKIKVYQDSSVFYRELVPSRGFQSSMDYKQIIGLGKLAAIDSMVITWPDRSTTCYIHPALNKVHYLAQPTATRPADTVLQSAQPALLENTPVSYFDKHTEDNYIDFYYERNLPEVLSREGPGVAKGDVNGDHLQDIYIGGAKGQAGQLYLQTATGAFEKKEQPVFKEFAGFEDVAAVFFDADKDGDLDLYLGAGNNNLPPGSREMQHRLYKNNGKGNFTIDLEAFPANDMNISVAAPCDYDGDGDLDLFVGSRSVPFNYGVTPESYLYQNNGNGHFKDIAINDPVLGRIGMVTGAVWKDVNGDNKSELIVTGEWMSTTIFSYNKTSGKFEQLTATGLEDLYGWWQEIAAGDINGDGFNDLVIGNVGENFYLHPSRTEPVKLWLNDFDNNGTQEQFLTRTVDKKDVPVFLKREITDQFPGLKKKNLRHSEYAIKTIQQLFGDDVLQKSAVKQFNYCSSIIAYNDGKGHFTIVPLPQMVQLSSVNAIELTDIDHDNKTDLLLGGNMFTFPPQFGRLDGSYGQVLLNQGKGQFKWLEPRASGIYVKGEIRSIQTIPATDKIPERWLIVQNNDYPLLFKNFNNQFRHP